MRKRTKARELCLKALYLLDSRGFISSESGPVQRNADVDEALDSFWETYKEADEITEFAGSLVDGVCLRLQEIDSFISDSASNWTLDRMSIVDRNILRVAVYEIVFLKETPQKVVINEAIEVAKRYGDDSSPAFINGVIDSVRKACCAL